MSPHRASKPTCSTLFAALRQRGFLKVPARRLDYTFCLLGSTLLYRSVCVMCHSDGAKSTTLMIRIWRLRLLRLTHGLAVLRKVEQISTRHRFLGMLCGH